MSVFTQENKDSAVAYTDQVTAGPRLGFLGSFEAAYDSQVRASSQFGLEAAMREEEQDNIRKIRQAGGKAPKSLNDNEDSEYIPRSLGGAGFTAGVNSGSYMDYARARADQDDIKTTAVLGDRDEQIKTLQEQYPNAGIRTYSDIFDSVRKRAQESEKLADTHRATVGGYVGGFLGTAGAALDPRVNPLNFLTLPVGAAGSTVGRRIATQFGAQGLIEGINQVTGVQENRRILGLESGFANAAGQVAGAAIGGAALQGLGEGVAAAGRKWFRAAPHDPAPDMPVPQPRVPQPGEVLRTIDVPPETAARIRAVTGELLRGDVTPIAKTRVGAARATADFDHVANVLERWDAPAPWEIPPTMATRPAAQAGTNVNVEVRPPSQDMSIDTRARAIDPETFSIFDKLRSEVDGLRGRIADIDTIREQSRLAAAADTTARQIDELSSQLAGAKPGSAKARKLEQQIADLEANRPAAPDVAPDAKQAEADMRAALMKADEDMRDLAPVVSRAYARARGEWHADERLTAQVDSMIASRSDILPGAKDIGEPPEELFRPYTVEMKVPELNRTDIPRGPNDTPADVVIKAQQADAKAAEVLLERQRAEISAILKDETGAQPIRFDGIDAELRASDTINIEGPDGNMRTVTIREAFKELDDDSNVLQAVSSCRLNRTS